MSEHPPVHIEIHEIKPDPFELCVCGHWRRSHDSAGCGAWVEARSIMWSLQPIETKIIQAHTCPCRKFEPKKMAIGLGDRVELISDYAGWRAGMKCVVTDWESSKPSHFGRVWIRDIREPLSSDPPQMTVPRDVLKYLYTGKREGEDKS